MLPAVIAYNLANLMRPAGPVLAIQTGGHLIRHARRFILQPAENHLTRRRLGQILGRIERLTGTPHDREPHTRGEGDEEWGPNQRGYL